MGWSGVRMTTSPQLSTKIHGAERVHTHQSLFWVSSRLKRREIFQTVYLRTKKQSSSHSRELAESLWVSDKEGFGHYLPSQSVEGVRMTLTPIPNTQRVVTRSMLGCSLPLLWLGGKTTSLGEIGSA